MQKAFILVLLITLSAALAGCIENDPEKRRQRLHIPPANFRPDPEVGRRVFEARCAECHGNQARGTDKGPPLVHPVYRSGHHADLTFHLAVRNGVRQHHWHFGDMPPQPDVSPEQAGHITSHIRRLQRQEGIR